MAAPGLRVVISARISAERRAAFAAAADQVFGTLDGAWTLTLRAHTAIGHSPDGLEVTLIGPNSISGARLALADFVSPTLEARLRAIHPSQ